MCFPIEGVYGPTQTGGNISGPSFMPSAQTVSAVGTGLQVGGVVSSVVGAYNKSKATKAAYEYQAAVDRNNATLDQYRARDAIYRGQVAENNQRLKTASIAGAQRARFAARGVALDEGSPLNILLDTTYTGDQDATTIADNAAREAWALRESARGQNANADLLNYRADAESPIADAGNTLLTGAGSVASTWYKLRTKTAYTS